MKGKTDNGGTACKALMTDESILQGIIDTVPMKRLAKPEEIGGACAYLASDIAGFMTGSTMNICGGLYYQ